MTDKEDLGITLKSGESVEIQSELPLESDGSLIWQVAWVCSCGRHNAKRIKKPGKNAKIRVWCKCDPWYAKLWNWLRYDIFS